MASSDSIFSWKRQTKKPAFSSRENIQDWVKQVQEACDDAAKDIFGGDARDVLSRREFCVDDDAIVEGQDLIDSWIKKRNIEDLLAECDITHEVSLHSTSFTQNDVLPGDFYHENGLHHVDSFINCGERNEVGLRKPAFDLDGDFDEECAVQAVMYDMLERDVIDLKAINDERKFNSKTAKFKDPTPKMKLRHEQVKKRASERKIAWEKANMKKLNQKTVEEEARKQLQREERERVENMKREEDEIRREMVKIRKIMQEENSDRTKLHNREARHVEKAKRQAVAEVRKYQEENERRLRQEAEAGKALKRKLSKQLQEEETRKQEDLKLLQSCFSAWYAVIVNNHIKCGKARALLEWRRKLRVWNCWRTYVLRSRCDRETRVLAEEMKERHRKEVLADRFYRQLLFHRCLTAWLSWVEKEKQDRKLREDRSKRAEKMATLLQAASSGQLWQKRKNEKRVDHGSGMEYKSHEVEDVEDNISQPFELQDVQQLFAVEGKTSSTASERSGNIKTSFKKHMWPHEKLREMTRRQPPKPTFTPDNGSTAVSGPYGSIHKRLDMGSGRAGYTTARNALTSRESRIPQEIQGNLLRSPKEDMNQGAHHSASRAIKSNLSLKGVVDVTANPTPRTKTEEKHFMTGYERNDVSLREKGVSFKAKDAIPPSTRSLSSTGSKSTVPLKKPTTKPLHLAMEERAKARAERKSLLEAKKRAAEDEKLARLRREQEEKEREIMAEKQAALLRKREETKLAKQREIEKQQRLEEIRKQNEKADELYRCKLLKKYGLFPWKKLLQTRENMFRDAEVFHQKTLQRLLFREWLEHTRTECKRRNRLADELYRSLLLRFGWKSWRKYRSHLLEMEKIVLAFSKRYIVRKYWRIWQDFVIEERLLYWDKENRADEHNDRRLKFKAMTYWKRYIPLLKEEEKREKRRNDLRKHVVSLLPDFQGLQQHHSP